MGDGTKTLTIISPETENYLSAVTTLELRLHKAKITIKLDNKRSAVFAEPQNLSYTLKYGTIFNNDDLEITYSTNFSTFIAGTYKITATAANQNYEVEILDGTYTIYIDGFGIALIILCIVVIVALAVLVVFFILKKRSYDKVLNASDFDETEF